MSTTCPEPQDLTRLLDGELTENRAARVRAHAAACTRCGGELEAQQALLEGLRAPLPGLPSAGALAAVMGRLDAADEAAASPAPIDRRPRRLAWLGLAAAAAAALVLVGVARPPPNRDDGFAARGAEVDWVRKIGVDLWALEGQPRRLAPDDGLARGVPLVASYSNVDPAPAWLLVFALDAQGEVHWLYPAYLDAAADPRAVRLEGAAVRRALPESVVLEGVPAGALRLVTVVTRTPHQVSEIEGTAPADRTPEALRRRWPDARVDELAVRYGAAPTSDPRARP
jgi:hypothetical protein